MSSDHYRPNLLSKFYLALGRVIVSILPNPISFSSFMKNYYLWILVPTIIVAYLLISFFITRRLPPLIIDILELLSAAAPSNDSESIRNYSYGLGALLTAFVVLGTLPLALIRTWINERNTFNAEQGNVTDRLNNAVEMLGSEKTEKYRARRVHFLLSDSFDVGGPKSFELYEFEGKQLETSNHSELNSNEIKKRDVGAWETFERTVPNLEVRTGAIYALERISQDSKRDHIMIMEILCSYVRENSPSQLAQNHGLGEWPQRPNGDHPCSIEGRQAEIEERADRLKKWASDLPELRVDIRAALAVISRRNIDRVRFERARTQRYDGRGAGYQLDLRHTNLQNADLSNAELDNALLYGARLEGANLYKARLGGATLARSKLDAADLFQAALPDADLYGASLEGANLFEANLAGAALNRARLERASLIGVNLNEVDFREAWMEQADLFGADLKFSEISHPALLYTRVRGADLRRVNGISVDQVERMFGDHSTKLDDSITRPSHWRDEVIEPFNRDRHFDDWVVSKQLGPR